MIQIKFAVKHSEAKGKSCFSSSDKAKALEAKNWAGAVPNVT